MALGSLATKGIRQRAIQELVRRGPIGSQEELVAALRERGMPVTQATVSRDLSELRIVKVPRGDRHVYLSTDDLGGAGADPTADGRLARFLSETPVAIGRSGLTLVLRGPLSSAQSLSRAIDESTLQEQEGTLGGDDTVLVLFADGARLERWLERFRALQGRPAAIDGGDAQAVAATPGRERSSGPT
jgi:transcriptional regulator of arginine metabolism